MPIRTKEGYRKSDARKTLTNVALLLHTAAMPRFTEVIEALKQQLAQDGKRVSEINEEMANLRASYNRFRDLVTECKAREARMLTTAELLGKHATQSELGDAFGDEVSVFKSAEEQHAGINLWQAMAEILRQIHEARVGEIYFLLSMLGIKTTRQAIESALKTHKRTFRVKKRDREKFISLVE